jgi:hypothetical protein
VDYIPLSEVLTTLFLWPGWWEELTEAGSEAMVVKPVGFIARGLWVLPNLGSSAGYASRSQYEEVTRAARVCPWGLRRCIARRTDDPTKSTDGPSLICGCHEVVGQLTYGAAMNICFDLIAKLLND